MILSPILTCPENVNRDGCVDLDDYDAIINHPDYDGECPPNVICHWDVNGDYMIDSQRVLRAGELHRDRRNRAIQAAE